MKCKSKNTREKSEAVLTDMHRYAAQYIFGSTCVSCTSVLVQLLLALITILQSFTLVAFFLFLILKTLNNSSVGTGLPTR